MTNDTSHNSPPADGSGKPHEASTKPSRHGIDRPKLPHERDESADSGDANANRSDADQEIADKAHADATSERVDTDCALGGRTDCPANTTGQK